MNWVDICLILVFLLAVVAGWRRGFILGTLDIISWTASFAIAYVGYPYTSKLLGGIFNMGVWLTSVSFIITIIIAKILVSLVTRTIFRSMPDKVSDNPVNKFLGVIPGAVNGFIYAVILSALLLAIPLKDSITAETQKSRLAGRLAMQSEWINRKLAPVFDQAVRQTMNSLSAEPRSDEKVALHFKYDEASPSPALEAQMLDLVNKERRKAGLKPLELDEELEAVARAHANDMFVNGYFAHVNLKGQDPFDRMKAAHIRFITAGENLALAQTLEIAHSNLMHSPGHRANILNPAFGRIGIGVMDGGFYGLMISQEFRN